MRFKITYNKSAGTITLTDKEENFSVWNEIVSDSLDELEVCFEVEGDELETAELSEGIE
jgi:hypothetical protein